IADSIAEAGCLVRCSLPMGEDERVICVTAKPDATLREFDVVTLSWASLPNFGDRLGVPLIDQLLPAHATVRHERRAAPSLLERPIDLLVLGLGYSVFQPMLTSDLMRLVDHSHHVIGIFGTQYRQSLDRSLLKALLRRLDVWYARYYEDLLLYGGE